MIIIRWLIIVTIMTIMTMTSPHLLFDLVRVEIGIQHEYSEGECVSFVDAAKHTARICILIGSAQCDPSPDRCVMMMMVMMMINDT